MSRVLRARFIAESVVLLCNACNEPIPNPDTGALNWTEEEIQPLNFSQIECECGQRIMIRLPRSVPAFREYPQDPPVRTRQPRESDGGAS